MGCMHACPRFLHLGVAVDSDTLFYVRLLPTGSKLCLPCVRGGPSPKATEGLWKSGALGGRDACIPPFKTPSMDVSSLHHEDMM